MTYLNADISFCELDGRLFFLDIQNDRYFHLSRTTERCFLTYLNAPDDASVDVSRLVKHNLLSQTESASELGSVPDIVRPSQSVLETPYLNRRIPAGIFRDVFLAVCMMRWQLKRRRLKPVLQGLATYRSARTHSTVATAPEHRQRLAETANAFNHVRPYVPIETRCLVDSLSMIRFLASHGFRAHLVIGVACDPFSAHAWVQHGPLVLNETVGAAHAHTPIRVI